MTSPTPSERAEGLVSTFLDDRFEKAGEPPGLREAVVDRLSQRIAGVSSRFGEQIDHLSSSSSDHLPDAYLADEEAVRRADRRQVEQQVAGNLGPAGPEADVLAGVDRDDRLARRRAASAAAVELVADAADRGAEARVAAFAFGDHAVAAVQLAVEPAQAAAVVVGAVAVRVALLDRAAVALLVGIDEGVAAGLVRPAVGAATTACHASG